MVSSIWKSNHSMGIICSLLDTFVLLCATGSHFLCSLFISELNNKTTDEKLNALVIASSFSHLHIIEFLLAYFDKIDLKQKSSSIGTSPLETVPYYTENKEILSLFNKYLANPDILRKELEKEQSNYFLFTNILLFFL